MESFSSLLQSRYPITDNPGFYSALLNGFDGWETVQHPVNLVDPHYLSFVKNVLPKVTAKS